MKNMMCLNIIHIDKENNEVGAIPETDHVMPTKKQKVTIMMTKTDQKLSIMKKQKN
jgi:hypothetical protein